MGFVDLAQNSLLNVLSMTNLIDDLIVAFWTLFHVYCYFIDVLILSAHFKICCFRAAHLIYFSVFAVVRSR